MSVARAGLARIARHVVHAPLPGGRCHVGMACCVGALPARVACVFVHLGMLLWLGCGMGVAYLRILDGVVLSPSLLRLPPEFP